MNERGGGYRPIISLKWRLVFASLLMSGAIFAQQSQQEKLDAFAKCLTKKNVIMYGSTLCPHCDDQKKLFGDSFKQIHYVECSPMGPTNEYNACKFAQVRYTPTWIISNGERLVGIQTLKQLSDKTGCTLP
jgi:hypothetical protein